jgi:hypothetical protein
MTRYREYEVRLEISATVSLPLPDGTDEEEFENCCDPDNEMTDREAIENAISSAISQQCEVFVYGEDREPAEVFIDLDSTDHLRVEGFEDE